MTVTIIPIEDHSKYSVNGHHVFKAFDNWHCNTGLSSVELEAFERYRDVIINNPRIKKHIKSTFKN